MEATAQLRYLRMSASKARVVLGLIRGKGVEDALNILAFTHRRASLPIAKLLRSAVANAQQQGFRDVDSLYVRTALADGGPFVKRFMPRAQGRATPIRKRTTHITIVVSERA